MVQVPHIATIDRSGNQNAFLVPTQIQVDRLYLRIEALYDTGAAISLAGSYTMAQTAHKSLGAEIIKQPKPLPLSDYRRQPVGKAIHKLVASFVIDGQQFPKQRFLILDIGHDIFIGQDWLVK
jgi:hypothetical protein